MATTRTRNLKLFITEGLSKESKANLEILDNLGQVYLVDASETVWLRSKHNIQIIPNDSSVGGAGTGGSVYFGTEVNQLDNIFLWSDIVEVSGLLSLKDSSSTNGRLQLKYDSSLHAVNDSGTRQLTLQVHGADRQVELSGNLVITNDVTLTTSGSNVTLPASGTLATLAGTETLTNKTIHAASNTIQELTNTNIAASAAISGNKLNLANHITDSHINTSAGIAYGKLYLTDQITNTDISSAANIDPTKVNLFNYINTSHIASNAGINYSKLNLIGNVKDQDIHVAAAIGGTKIVPEFGNQQITTENNLKFIGPGNFYTILRSAQVGQVSNIVYTLPADTGLPNAFLATDGAGNLSWNSAGSGTVTSVAMSVPSEFSVSGSPITTTGTFAISKVNQAANVIYAGPSSGGAAQPTFRSMVVDDIPELPPSKLAPLTASRVVVSDGSGVISASSVTSTTLGFLDATSSVQTQLNGKQPLNTELTGLSSLTLTGYVKRTGAGVYTAVSSFVNADIDSAAAINFSKMEALTGDKVLVSTAGGIVSASAVTTTTLGYLDATSSIQTQLNSKAAASSIGSYAEDWTAGTSLSVVHNLNTRDVIVQIYDNTTYEDIMIDSIVRSTLNSITVTASIAPSGPGWRVLVKKIT